MTEIICVYANDYHIKNENQFLDETTFLNFKMETLSFLVIKKLLRFICWQIIWDDCLNAMNCNLMFD